MTVEDAKKIFSEDVATVSTEILQKAAKIILSELGKAEEKIAEFEEKAVGDLPGEIWKDIDGYEGKYKVSNKGRVKSFYKDRIKILAPIKKLNRYNTVTLCLPNNQKTFLIHRLVATAFVPNPENLPVVHHKDDNKKNNCAENLQWVTDEENKKYAYENGLCKKGEDHPNAKLTAEQVKFIRKNYIPFDEEFGRNALAKKFGVSKSIMSQIIHEKSYIEL